MAAASLSSSPRASLPRLLSLLPISLLPTLVLLLAFPLPAARGEISDALLEADKRAIVLFDTFGFESNGHVDMNVSSVEVLVPENAAAADKTLMGFFLTTAEDELELQNDFQAGHCVLANSHVHRLFTLQDVVSQQQGPDKPFTFHYSVPDAKEYSLFFANCQPHARVSLNCSFALYNVAPSGRIDYLPGGKTQLPMLYSAFYLAYMVAGIVWIYLCHKHWARVHRIHILMGVLVLLKAFTVLSQAGEYAYIRATGDPQGWNIAFYVFSFFRGIMLFTVIVLIGTGWSVLKPYLQDKEKKVILIVIPLQVFANIATIILDESGPSSQSWFTWRDIFHLLDILCCCAVFFPIIWSIKHLREAAHSDGKAARIVAKLQLFRHFYVLVVCYIYFTRIVVYVLRSTMPYQYAWTADLAGELVTLVFYCVTGYQFRPMEENPFLAMHDDDTGGEGIEMDKAASKPLKAVFSLDVDVSAEQARRQQHESSASHLRALLPRQRLHALRGKGERNAGGVAGGVDGGRRGAEAGSTGRGGAEQGGGWEVGAEEKFLWYASHSGFSNQVMTLSRGLHMAALLNRTLLIPPKLAHFNHVMRHSVLQSGFRDRAWAEYSLLLRSPEYLSMGDVLDVGAISPALVRTMDLRHFVARHCRCNVSVSCPGHACRMLFQGIAFSNQSLTQCLQVCGARIGASTPTPARLWGTFTALATVTARTGLFQSHVLLPSDPALSVAEWERKGVLYAVPHMCNETIWTVGNYSSKSELLQALGGGKVRYDHGVCRDFRRDPHRFPLPLSVHLLQQPPLSSAQVMAFGSMFDIMITDLNLHPSDRIRRLQQESVPFFSRPIVQLARDYIRKHMPLPYACLHLRANEASFVRKRNATLSNAEQSLWEILQQRDKHTPGGTATLSSTLHLFLMTDLREEAWADLLLPRLARLPVPVQVHTLAPFKHRLLALSMHLRGYGIGLRANRFFHEEDSFRRVEESSLDDRDEGDGMTLTWPKHTGGESRHS
ncbi:unnamed protein product [Closterium sp. Yama58-4]|nr:unnamed protein product [Closterium sp. Yama58-4]